MRTRTVTGPLVLLFLFTLPALADTHDAPQRADDVLVPWKIEEPHAESTDETVFALTCREEGARRYYAVPVHPNPYERVSAALRMAPRAFKATERWVVAVSFLDKGAGILSALLELGDTADKTSQTLSPTRQACYTRLNTGMERRAYFEFLFPSDVSEATPLTLVLQGFSEIGDIFLLSNPTPDFWENCRRSIPTTVTPMVTFRRPMQCVISAGLAVTAQREHLNESLDALRELAPLARVLGFTAVESYVPWNSIEPNREGEWDFSVHDAAIPILQQYGLKWFPLLIVGSAYALPRWFRDSDDHVGMVCLEHLRANDIESVFTEPHQRHVQRYLRAFGEKYEPMGILEGVRLGPSGNYGESQYPAGGNWGPEGKQMHIHIGWWAGDRPAVENYQKWLAQRYNEIAALNAAWGTSFTAWEEILPRIPEHMETARERVDFTQWYTDAMSNWCDFWAKTARAAMPNTVIFQSAGGWGFREAGTDYVAQARSMRDIGNSGIRLTNETDSFEQNFYVTRLANTAARYYGIRYGTEPASSHTARGVVARLFELITGNGDHFFTYYPNLMAQPPAVEKWLTYAPLLDERARPRVEVAVYYPETMNQLEDGAFRHLYAGGFYYRAAALRRVCDLDYLDEQLIREGALTRYKVLAFVWGDKAPADVLAAVDAWVKDGGVVIYPSFPRTPLTSLEGDAAIFQRWKTEETGKRFFLFSGDMEPPSHYATFMRAVLRGDKGEGSRALYRRLHPATRLLVDVSWPEHVFGAVLEDDTLWILNYRDDRVVLPLLSQRILILEPYSITRIDSASLTEKSTTAQR